MKSKTLVQTWLEVELVTNRRSLADVLRELNKDMGSKHTHSRVREWETQRRGRGGQMPTKLRVYMAMKVARNVLKSCGITEELSQRMLRVLVTRLVA